MLRETTVDPLAVAQLVRRKGNVTRAIDAVKRAGGIK